MSSAQGTESPIGVFDSGIGGLSILREVTRLLPEENVHYLADQAWAPYGERSLTEVRARAVAVASFLIGRGAKLIVVACNSASAAALHHLRKAFPDVPFVGMEPAVKPAARASSRGVIGVLATPATFQGELYASVVGRHANGVTVVEAEAIGLAAAIEAGDDAEIATIVTEHVSELVSAGADTIVLGCTHYHLVADIITRAAGPDVRLVDPSAAVARQVGRLVEGAGRRHGEGRHVAYFTTGDPAAFSSRIATIVTAPVDAEAVVV